jgi:hypothetical protein
MHLGAPVAQGYADEIDSPGTSRAPQTSDVTSLGLINRIDGVAGTRDGSDLDCHSGCAVESQEVYLSTPDFDIPRRDLQALLPQPPRRQSLPGLTEHRPAVAQSFSSVFSSFSTLTSRKVRTCTFSRNLAGRNMSQTQASTIVTSK